MTWFDRLMGFEESSPDQVRRHLKLEGQRLHSLANGRSFQVGQLTLPSLGELRAQGIDLDPRREPSNISQVVGDIQEFHKDPGNQHALFQVASQFNLLEMVYPGATPEMGVGIYEDDFTQGPACAIAAGAGTIYRNYLVPVGDQVGQSESRQLDGLADLGAAWGNDQSRLWEMTNGYCLPSAAGLAEIDGRLAEANEEQRDQWRQLLRIGVQRDTEVTIAATPHPVTQVYCSAVPVSYSAHPASDWQRFASLVLEAAYEATLLQGVINRQATGNNLVFLTLLGGGAFGNSMEWILDAIAKAYRKLKPYGLDVRVVSFRTPQSEVSDLIEHLADEGPDA